MTPESQEVKKPKTPGRVIEDLRRLKWYLIGAAAGGGGMATAYGVIAARAYDAGYFLQFATYSITGLALLVGLPTTMYLISRTKD